MRWGAMFWAIILIVIGSLLFLNNLGVISVNVWAFVPAVMLIVLGVWFLLGGVFRREMASEAASIPLGGSSRAALRLRHGAGRLTLGSGAASGELVRGTFVGGLAHRERRQGDVLEADLSVPADVFGHSPWMWGPGRSLDWTVELTREVPLTLDLEMGANEARLNLNDLRVTDLRVKSGASNTTISLPAAAGLVRGKVEAGAASLALRVPAGVAGRFRVTGLTGTTVDSARFARSGDEYRSADFDSAANKVDFEITMGAGSVDIR